MVGSEGGEEGEEIDRISGFSQNGTATQKLVTCPAPAPVNNVTVHTLVWAPEDGNSADDYASCRV